ncbi:MULTISPECIES: glycosyltransferase [unclassified Modestobacter]|uniref:glycosyltransferase n=1 Tax=unclassified Modestobacter TaxID=2643866 RepID=UPI0022AA3BF4|nr:MULTISPECIES: glycosyltransferase [unclassified Modestobacter]MCZ2825592.1 glycosyltransferase [Modestobacter sp. VKM Ac-2981]MCZ2853343.1 glycosyltransferase [Modestobacter sp. VKM Ac-2982]
MREAGPWGAWRRVRPVVTGRRPMRPAAVRSGTDRRLVVLHSLREPDGTTQYADQMVDGAASDVDIRFFDWQTGLFGRYDVLHVHWPELLIRDSRRPWLRFVKRRLLDLLLLRLRLRRIPLVWTAHNLNPHEQGSRADHRSLDRFYRHVDLVIRLNPASPVTAGRETVTIPHGHYREPFSRYAQPEAEPGRVLYFGIIRPYKGVDLLIAAFRGLPSDDLRLRIVGNPHPGQAELVHEACQGDPRIDTLLRLVSDEELVEEIRRSQLVVLPYRGSMHNSGSLFAALSLGRPVLVPESPTNAALAEEVGPGWILQYSGELTPEVLGSAIASTASRPSAEPRLDDRDWARIGLHHRDAYRRARALSGRG